MYSMYLIKGWQINRSPEQEIYRLQSIIPWSEDYVYIELSTSHNVKTTLRGTQV